MTDYKKLAQRIVALGVGKSGVLPHEYDNPPTCYALGIEYIGTAEQFCNDGRVVLALMERCRDSARLTYMMDGINDRQWGDDESLAVAICEACCDALEEANDE